MSNDPNKSLLKGYIHLPCPSSKCTSSDAFSVYEDGHGYCQSCGYYTATAFEEIGMEAPKEQKPIEIPKGDEVVDYISFRDIPEDVFKYYDVLIKTIGGEPYEASFPYGEKATKYRNLLQKKFHTKGSIQLHPLFGMERFDKNSRKFITITEGEFDAMAVRAMVGDRTAAVSVHSANQALKNCKDAWHYINSFDRIILAFDNDDPGKKAAKEVSKLFAFDKLYIVYLDKYKDPNEYLMNNAGADFLQAWTYAKHYTPEHIIHQFNEIELSLSSENSQMFCSYPHSGLQEKLFGIHGGELICFKGEEGIGKTEIFRWIEHHILKNDPESKVALIHLEDDNGDPARGIATYEDQFPHIHPENNSNVQAILDAYKRAVGGKDDRIYIYDKHDIDNDDDLLDTIRYLVAVCGVKYVFLDHITWLAIGSDQEDERKRLDRISRDLRYMCKDLGCAILMISHTNDDGKTRGSRYITKASHTVIHMERNKISESENEKLRTKLIVEKARKGGQTGRTHPAVFNPESMTLYDVKPETEFKLLGT